MCMKAVLRLAVSVVALVLSAPAHAQLEEFERVLIPAHNALLPGVGGVFWISELHIFNAGGTPARAFPQYTPSRFSDFAPHEFVLPPERTSYVWLVGDNTHFPVHSPVSSRVLYLERGAIEKLHVNLRLSKLFRETGEVRFAAEIPVIRQAALLRGTTQLVRVPMADNTRQMLRIMDPDRRGDGRVRVRILLDDLESSPSPLLYEIEVTLAIPDVGSSGYHADDPSFPGYAQLADLRGLLGDKVTPSSHIRVEVTPLTNGLRYWAFVSVTDNTTQEVMLISPQ